MQVRKGYEFVVLLELLDVVFDYIWVWLGWDSDLFKCLLWNDLLDLFLLILLGFVVDKEGGCCPY